MIHRNEQEEFWAGEFGAQYSDRNKKDSLLTSNMHLFADIIRKTRDVNTVIEYGANIGLNLRALNTLFPHLALTAVEINNIAVEELKKNPWVEVHHQSILEFVPQKTYDLAFTKGVLIHISPDDLNKVYERLYESTNKYLMVAEYYNPVPTTIEYRGHKNKLFKRDFCSDLLDKFSDLYLIDYGFCYHRDNFFPQDDITWFLLEKIN